MKMACLLSGYSVDENNDDSVELQETVDFDTELCEFWPIHVHTTCLARKSAVHMTECVP